MEIPNIFSIKKREVGDTMTIIDREGNEHKAKVVEKCENNPKYTKTQPNGQVVNGGKDYYKVEIVEEKK